METGPEIAQGRLAEALAARSMPFPVHAPQKEAIEPGMVATSGPTLYTHQGQSISCSALARLPDVQQQGGQERMSRSLTCLGLSETIPEGAEDEEDSEQQPVVQQFSQSHHVASRSATDLAGMGFGQGEEDVFSSMGGFEMDSAGMAGTANRVSPFKVSTSPSRTIIVGNVPSAAADEHLKALFQAYGDIQGLKTEYKAHGVVVVSFFDLRAALNAKRQLEGVALSDQPLTVQYSASGTMLGNFGEGTLLIFNVDPQANSQTLVNTFSVYGDVRQIQDVPDKKNHRLIEFYDIRHANAAMTAINKSVVGDSRQGSQRMRPVASHADLDNQAQQEAVVSEPLARSWDDSSAAPIQKSQVAGAQQGNDAVMEAALGGMHPPDDQFALPRMTKSTSMGSGLADLAMNTTQQAQASSGLSPLTPGIAGGALPLTDQLAKGLQISDSASSLGNRAMGQTTPLMQQSQGNLIPNSLQAQFASLGLVQQAGLMNYPQAGLQSLGNDAFGLGPAVGQDAADAQGVRGPPPGFGTAGMTGLGFGRGLASSISVGSGLDNMGQRQAAWNAALTGLNQGGMAGASGVGMGIAGVDGTNVPQLGGGNLGQQLWGSGTNPYQAQGSSLLASQQGANIYQALANLQQAGANIPALLAQVNPGVAAASTQNNFWNQHAAPGNTTLVQGLGGNVLSSLVSSGPPVTQERGGMSKSSSSPALGLVAEEGREHRETHKSGGRLSRRNVDPVLEAERKTQQQRLYALDLEKVRNGEDTRTTLMIKNIPNKYTQKMLLASIDEVLKGKFDFFYLPIDFKNKCNVGYGFINVTDPRHIEPLMEKFHNKKWERFNSEKVCCVTYARIQGKSALINHFQNSSLMHEDKKHRPVLFYSDGPQFGEAEPFPVGPNVRPRITFKDRDFRSRERSGFWG